MGKQKEAKGQITLVGLSGVTQYFLKPSVTQVVIKNDGSLNTDVVTCTAYKAEDAEMTELSSSEGVIKYTVDNGSEYIDYTDDGVPVDTNWSIISFFLFLTGMSNYQVRADVSIIRNGQVDTNFRVWVGTQANPNSPFQRPWLGEEGEPQTDDMHVGDYYVSPNMQYYHFGYNNITSSYEWDEVTDVNLKKWLARADNSTTGFIVPEGTSVTDYFRTRDYVIGDLWANATYGTYNNEPLICKQSKNSTFGFRIEDWQPISDIKEKLRNTGINIDEYKVIVSGDETWFVNNNGERQAVFNFQGDHPVISTDLLQIDGGLIVGALSSEPQVFQDFMQDSGYNSVAITKNEEGDIQATIGGIPYTWTSKETKDLVQYSTTTADGVTNNFSLSKQGLLTAHNAVIYGKVYASEGAFTGQLSSSGGAFNVDRFGNVTATSFNGTGVIRSGKTVITKDNFYDYFNRSQLDLDNAKDQNGVDVVDGYGCLVGKRWIPNLKKLQKNIYFESVPEAALCNVEGHQYLYVVMPHDQLVSKNDKTEKSRRRGDLTYAEFLQLDGQQYSMYKINNLDFSVIVILSYITVQPDDISWFYLTDDQTTGGVITQFAHMCYKATSGGYSYNLVPYLIHSDSYDGINAWCDIELNDNSQNQTNSNPSVSGSETNKITTYDIQLFLVNNNNATFCFNWSCSSKLKITDIGSLSLFGYYKNIVMDGDNIVSIDYSPSVLRGTVLNSKLVNNELVAQPEDASQQGYLCIVDENVKPNFVLSNSTVQIKKGNIIYNITVC